MSCFIHKKNLKADNTFGVNAIADYFFEIKSEADILYLCDNEIFKKNNILIIGNGSNILFTSDFAGLVVKSGIKNIDIESENEHFVYINVGSGTDWNDVIHFALSHNIYGIENLVDIPGCCGGAVVQNIGAYGVEICNVVEKVRGRFLSNPKEIKELTNTQCRFGYRSSIFKSDEYCNKFFITDVTLKLSKKFVANIKYSGVEQALKQNGIYEPTGQDVVNIISKIRSEKLPDVKKIGSAGSFFKNPIVKYEQFKDIIEKYNLKIYPSSNLECKLSAAQLIEIAGFKGKKCGDVGTYDKHSLILCNYGKASGEAIYEFALQIVEKVDYMFGIKLTSEVIIW